MPLVEPGAWTHGKPGQQSAEVVHVLPCGMQEPAAPHWLLTQGLPQQSALVAQTAPSTGGGPRRCRGAAGRSGFGRRLRVDLNARSRLARAGQRDDQFAVLIA